MTRTPSRRKANGDNPDRKPSKRKGDDKENNSNKKRRKTKHTEENFTKQNRLRPRRRSYHADEDERAKRRCRMAKIAKEKKVEPVLDNGTTDNNENQMEITTAKAGPARRSSRSAARAGSSSGSATANNESKDVEMTSDLLLVADIGSSAQERLHRIANEAVEAIDHTRINRGSFVTKAEYKDILFTFYVYFMHQYDERMWHNEAIRRAKEEAERERERLERLRVREMERLRVRDEAREFICNSKHFKLVAQRVRDQIELEKKEEEEKRALEKKAISTVGTRGQVSVEVMSESGSSSSGSRSSYHSSHSSGSSSSSSSGSSPSSSSGVRASKKL